MNVMQPQVQLWDDKPVGVHLVDIEDITIGLLSNHAFELIKLHVDR